MNVHIYKCLNPKYTHGQLYTVQMYNVQKGNVQKGNVQKDNVLNMCAVLGVILTFFFVGAGAAQRRRSGILSDPLDCYPTVYTLRTSSISISLIFIKHP